MKSKIFAIMLAVLMVVSILPTGVFADGGVAKYNGGQYATLQDAIDAAEAANYANIVIDLLADVKLDIMSQMYLPIGTDATKTITINGNGHTLTFNQKHASDNHVVTNGAKLILNDMTIAGTRSNSISWNVYDIVFGCEVELNNVTSNRPLAFETNASLNNVTIMDPNNDVYAIWIRAAGQTVKIDGLTVKAGRGIKIDEQYVEHNGLTVAAVTLTVNNAEFDTNKKAAIMVKSEKGADISVSNIDISKVAADNINAVWVDEETKTEDVVNVTVSGSTVAEEVAGNTSTSPTRYYFNANGGSIIGEAYKVVQPGKPIGKLPTATKRGHDFIGWEVNGIMINETTVAIGDVCLTAVYDANELGNTELLPRLYPLTVIAGEGGTVEGFSGEKDLIIAFGAGRKIEIVPEEGYEIKDVIVNGKYHLGAVEEYKIVSAHMAYTVEAVFAPVPVYTPVYTENFDGETTAWVSGGTTEAAVLADGKLTVKSTGGDPNINMPEALNIACDTIDEIVVKYTNNTENTSFQIFFTNEANPGYSEAGSFKATCAAGENEIVIKTEGNELWTGTLANMRIDLSNGEGEFIVDEITFNTVATVSAAEVEAAE